LRERRGGDPGSDCLIGKGGLTDRGNGRNWPNTVYPTCRVPANALPLRIDLPSLGTLARASSYRTVCIGRWHLDGVPRSKFTPPGPRHSPHRRA